MTLSETIYKRRTARGYDMTPLGDDVLEDIQVFAYNLKPLYGNIRTHCEFVGKRNVKSILPWKAPHYAVIFSEEKDGYLTNVGFMYQQLDLYLQSIGLGCCWLGLGKFAPDEEGAAIMKSPDADLRFVIVMAFGKAKNSPHRELSAFKRKPLSEISDREDERLEPARLAPSGKNSQPWYFLHDDDNIIHGLIKAKDQDRIKRIDIGCALAHLYVENPDSFEFFIKETPRITDGYTYIGSIKI